MGLRAYTTGLPRMVFCSKISSHESCVQLNCPLVLLTGLLVDERSNSSGAYSSPPSPGE